MKTPFWHQNPAALIAVLLITACGDARGPATSADNAAAGRAPLQFQVFGDPAELQAYRELIAGYEARHENHKVALIPVGKQKDHMAKLTAAFAAKRPPDVFVINYRRYGQFAARGVLEPLGPALTGAGFEEQDFYAPAVDAFRFDGQLMCLPQNVSSLVVYYNRALFKRYDVPEPGVDWTAREFLSAAQRLTRDEDRDGRIDTYGVALDPMLIRVAPFIWSVGGDLVNDVSRPTILTLDRPQALRALDFVRSLNLVHRVVPGLAEYHAEDSEARFARGGLGMLFHSRRYTTTLRHAAMLDWDVAPMPRFGERPAASALHADAYCLARGTAQRPAALAFIRYALSDEGQALLTRSGRLVPARRAVAESPVFLDPTQPPARARVFLDAIPHLRRTPSIATWHEIETRADTMLEEWFYEPPAGGVDLDAIGGGGREIALPLRDMAQPLLLEALTKPGR